MIALKVGFAKNVPCYGKRGIQPAEDVDAFVAVVGFRVLDRVEHRRVGGGEGRVEHPVVGVNEVFRRDWDTIRPFCIRVQVEGPLGEIRVVFPTGGYARDHFVVLGRVVGDKAFEEAGEDLAFRNAGDNLKVETAGFSGISDEEYAVAVGAFDHGFALATGEQEQGKEEGDGAETDQRAGI